MKRTLSHLKTCFLLLLLLPLSLMAGSGTITPAPPNSAGIRGLMNFTVNYRFVPTAGDLADMEAALRTANDLICDATDGQIVFGDITITAGSVNEDLADIWVLPQPGRSVVSFWSDGSGFGRAGAHVNLFSSGVDGPTIAHELAHLAFGLGDGYDEQCRFGGPCGLGPNFDPGAIDDVNNTLMQSLSMTELSVAINHDLLRGDGSGCPPAETCAGTGLCTGDACTGYDSSTGRYEATQHTLIHGGVSEWEILDQNYPALSLDVPTLPNPAPPSGCQAFISFDVQVAGSNTVVLCMDRSGSMQIQDVGDITRMDFAKAAGRAFIDLQRNNNIKLGIVQFNQTASTVRNVEDLSAANAQSFKDDLDLLIPDGNTAIGNGLIESRVDLEVAKAVFGEENVSNPTIFLLSDGENNRGADPDEVAENIIDAGIVINSVPVGNGADTELLNELAGATGGVMYPAPNAENLPAIYAQMAARHQGFSLINTNITLEEHIFFEFPSPALRMSLPVEVGAGPLKIFLGLKNVSDFNLEVENIGRSVDLFDPNGNWINTSDLVIANDAFYRILELPNPVEGTYTLYVSNGNLISPQLDIVSFVENERPDFYIDAEPKLLSAPVPVNISAHPIFETTLFDPAIQYSAGVLRPDSSIVPLNVEFDPSTGVEAATFNNFNGPGTYRVVIGAVVPEGAASMPGEIIFDAPGDFIPDVERFIRTASTSFTLVQPGECPPCSPNNPDCDGDGLPNEFEDAYPNQDVDGDGLPNSCDEDSDGDDIPDQLEQDFDLDQNGVPDVYEQPEGFGCSGNPEFELIVREVVEPDCGQSNGIIEVATENAEGDVSYGWSHEPGLDEPLAQGLPAFIYAVTATDEAGCSRTATINLTEDCEDINPNPGILVNVGCFNQVPQACEFPVTVTVDMSATTAPNDRLGNFTAILSWDTAQLEYAGPSDILSGFNGFINLDEDNGELLFNGANTNGIDGVMDIFKTRFRAIGPVGAAGSVKIEFLSFAAANTFEDLRPQLNLKPCTYQISPAGLLGDLNNDGFVTSTDGNIALSYDAGLALPAALLARIENNFGDVNFDGQTNATDALIILTFDAQFPVPYPVGEPFCPSEAHAEMQIRGNSSIDILMDVERRAQTNAAEVPVYADLTGQGFRLGSYKATISWDPAVLRYREIRASAAGGFGTPVVNDELAAQGQLTLTHANPMGAAGLLQLFQLSFEELAANGASSLSVRFDNMASATDFQPLAGQVQFEDALRELLSPIAEVSAFPNPFSGQLELAYTLAAEGEVEISLHDVLGQRTATLFRGRQEAGPQHLQWNATGDQLQPGAYLLRIVAGEQVYSQTVMYMRK